MKSITISLSLLLVTIIINAQQLAFPSAEGCGKYTTGGRGGRVVFVTHLKDNLDKFSAGYKGSLRAALEEPGNDPITIVFKVGGVISPYGALNTHRSNITIAGQTALGNGICIKGYGIKFSGNNIIVRHMRFRVGDEILQNDPALTFSNGKKAIFDHCSFSWSIEENVNITDVDSVTVQWCINSESLYASQHAKGNRGYGAQWGGENATYHHNLLAHHNSRMPRQNGAKNQDIEVNWDYRNNVNYNWGNTGAFYGGMVELLNGYCHSNVINNYFKPGPATTSNKSGQYFCSPSIGDPDTYGWGKWYLEGNFMFDNPEKTNDNLSGLNGTMDFWYPEEFATMPIAESSAETAYIQVLNNAGATKPSRDDIDKRIVNEVYTGTATYGGILGSKKGIIDSQEDLKPEDAEVGWRAWNIYEKINNSSAPLDTDEDGIPDTWEDSNGLNKNNHDDGKIITESGYSNLEIYLNELAGDINTSTSQIKDIETKIKVYPNPSSNKIQLSSILSIKRYYIINLQGSSIINENIEGSNYALIDISTFSNGIYLLKIEFENGLIEFLPIIKK